LGTLADGALDDGVTTGCGALNAASELAFVPSSSATPPPENPTSKPSAAPITAGCQRNLFPIVVPPTPWAAHRIRGRESESEFRFADRVFRV
jgi:hypothetical protein